MMTPRPTPAMASAPTNQYRRTPPRKSMTAPMPMIIMAAEKCGSMTSRATTTTSTAAKGRMPYFTVRILPRNLQMSAAK